jgi:outer membrane protein OmpA-like peptidoglycan-associated protein
LQPGGGLNGEVSGLSGEITDFRVGQTATSTIVEIASDVLFAFDSADISAAAPAQLNRAADLIRQGGPGPIEVRGHTDSKGNTAYNLGLSERRAMEVAGWLRANAGIDAGRLKPRGMGETDPVAPNVRPDGADDPAGRALNRRVTIVIPKA